MYSRGILSVDFHFDRERFGIVAVDESPYQPIKMFTSCAYVFSTAFPSWCLFTIELGKQRRIVIAVA